MFRLSSDYHEFLKQVGWGSEALWRGSDYTLNWLPDMQESALELLVDAPLDLPKNSFVSFMHQGYQFFFLNSEGIFYFSEGVTENKNTV